MTVIKAPLTKLTTSGQGSTCTFDLGARIHGVPVDETYNAAPVWTSMWPGVSATPAADALTAAGAATGTEGSGTVVATYTNSAGIEFRIEFPVTAEATPPDIDDFDPSVRDVEAPAEADEG